MDPTARVVDVLASVCALPRERLRPDVTLESLGLDSLSLLEVGLALGTEFGVEFDDAEVAGARTVGDLVRVVVASGQPIP
jgi:acyl carrier protein